MTIFKQKLKMYNMENLYLIVFETLDLLDLNKKIKIL
jgi:hypothetical protein